MNNKIKKIVSVFIVLSLINWMFAFADEKFVSEMNIIEIEKEDSFGKKMNLKNFSIWDILKTDNEKIFFNYNDKLKIELLKKSEFKFKDFNHWNLSAWKVSVSSLSDYSVKVWSFKVVLKNSWVVVEKKDSKVDILSMYWVNEVSFRWEKFLLLEWNKISINEDTFLKKDDIFSKIEKINFSKKEIKDVDKVFVEDKEYFFHDSLVDVDFFENLIVFDDKKKKNKITIEKKVFNNCIKAISKLTKKEKDSAWKKASNNSALYRDIENKCITSEVLANKEFAKKFENNFENISLIKEKYLIDEKRKKFLWENFSFLEKIFYLQKNISSSDIKNFPFFLNEVEKAFNKEGDLKNLEMWFVLIDWILKNNLQFSFEKMYDFRWEILHKILWKFYWKDWDKLNSYTEKVIASNFTFVETLLKNKNFKELDYIFTNKFTLENPRSNKNLKEILLNYDKAIANYAKILDSSKNIFHWSAEEFKRINDIKAEEVAKEKKEAEIKTMLDSFEAIEEPEVEITTKERKIEIRDIFNKYWFKLDLENIRWFMDWWNLFYADKVTFLENKYDLVFDLNQNVVSRIKWKDFDWEWSMLLSKFKSLVSTDNFKASSFDASPSNVFQDIEEKDFSQEDFLKKELARKYLKSVWVFVEKKDISKIDWDNYSIKNAKTEKYEKLEIWFNIRLITWSISNASFSDNNSDNINLWINFNLAKNLKSLIEKKYWDFLLRKANIVKVISDLAWLWISKKDVFLWEGAIDWFKVYKWFNMSSWKAILSWEYFVWTNTFKKARFTLWNTFEDFDNVLLSDLIDRIKYINKNIDSLEKIKSEKELNRIKEEQRIEEIKVLNYWDSIPDELLDWDWITD
jgi:hypothetical protein